MRTLGVTAAISMVAILPTATAAAQTTATCDGLQATIVGTSGADTLTGTPGPDVIAGLQGNDVIDGGGGDDVICGGIGNDRISGGEGFDIIFGAQGNDVIYAANGASTALREDTRGARMFGGAGNDTIHGTARWDRMQGGPGDDNLFGYEGRDWMRAGADNDSVDGGPGIDDLHGGNGRDTIQLTSGDFVRGGAGFDQCNLGSGMAERIISCGLNEREAPVVPAGTFRHTDFQDDSWTGQVYGIVDAEIGEFNNVEGRCFLLVGEITPGFISDGVISNGFRTPEFGVIVGGEYLNDGTECDTTAAEELGYEWILRAQGTSGTDIPFYSEIFIPSEMTGPITEVVIGNPRETGASISVAPDFLPTIPTPRNLSVGSVVPNEGPIGVGAEFSHERLGDEWMGRVTEIEEVGFDQFSNSVGRCYLVLGDITPTVIDEGTVSNRFTTPMIGVIADGRYFDRSTNCETSGAEARGFDWILNPEVTLNTRYDYYSEVFIPELYRGEITHVVVGISANSEDAFIFRVN